MSARSVYWPALVRAGASRRFGGVDPRAVLRWLLGGGLLVAGVGHLTIQGTESRAQVPGWFPVDEDLVVVASGIVESRSEWPSPDLPVTGSSSARSWLASSLSCLTSVGTEEVGSTVARSTPVGSRRFESVRLLEHERSCGLGELSVADPKWGAGGDVTVGAADEAETAGVVARPACLRRDLGEVHGPLGHAC
jgi:hypothetical protein